MSNHYNNKWKINFSKLKDYKEKNGHCNVSTKDPNYSNLGQWVKNQRSFFNNLPKDKSKWNNNQLNCYRLLESIDFSFSIRKFLPRTKWTDRITELRNYKANYKTLNVSKTLPEHKALGQWLANT